jgi:hypothetical protein
MSRTLIADGITHVDIEPSDSEADVIEAAGAGCEGDHIRSREAVKREQSRRPQKRSRSPRRTIVGLQDNLVRRGAINSDAASSSLSAPGPQSLVNGNWMIANWYIGKDCNPREFEKKLEGAPFDCVVLVFPEHGLKNAIVEYN